MVSSRRRCFEGGHYGNNLPTRPFETFVKTSGYVRGGGAASGRLFAFTDPYDEPETDPNLDECRTAEKLRWRLTRERR